MRKYLERPIEDARKLVEYVDEHFKPPRREPIPFRWFEPKDTEALPRHVHYRSFDVDQERRSPPKQEPHELKRGPNAPQ